LTAIFAILRALGMFVAGMFKSRSRLHLVFDFAAVTVRLLIWMTRLWPGLLGLAQVVQPATILRWHRAGFKVFWRWKSQNRAGRPKIDREAENLLLRHQLNLALRRAPRLFLRSAKSVAARFQ